jgi:hypothetical protein
METFSDIFAFMAGLPGLALVVLAALILFLTSDWRLSLTALLVEYIALGLLLTRFVPPEIGIAKILTGVFVVSMLYLTGRRVQEARQPLGPGPNEGRFLGLQLGWGAGPLGLPLRFLAVLLVALALVRLFGDYRLTLVPLDVAFAASWLASTGILGLVLSGDLLRVAPALLTILIGFDLIYTGLESDLAITGLLSAFTLFAALAFSYLTTIQGLSQTGQEPKEEVEA